jgi:CelD/BcsL family acetyltransferase involved in cellulose biosynthesis
MRNSSLKLEIISPPSWPARLLPAWSNLLEQTATASIFLSPEWIGAWWRAYGEGHEPRLWAVWNEQGALVALAPFYIVKMRVGGLVDLPVIRFMGDEGGGAEYLGLLAESGREEEVLQSLAGAMGSQCALVDIRGLPEGDALTRLIPKMFGERAPWPIHEERHACSRVLLPDDYEAYLRSLRSKFRSSLRYQTNRLVKNHNARLLRTSAEEDLDAHLDRFFAMHQERWVTRGDTGSFHDPRKLAFYREIAAAFLRRGWLRFYHLEVDKVIRASQFGFAYRGTLYSLQEAIDHSFHPPGVDGFGVVLRGMAIRESITEGLGAYDFLGGVEEFKTRWGTIPHYIHRVEIGIGLAGSLTLAGLVGWRLVKNWGRTHAPDWLRKARHFFRPPTASHQSHQSSLEFREEEN